MREMATKRLQQLRDEYAAGQQVLVELQNKQAELHQTLLRISGAIQVLEELSENAPSIPSEAAAPPPAG